MIYLCQAVFVFNARLRTVLFGVMDYYFSGHYAVCGVGNNNIGSRYK